MRNYMTAICFYFQVHQPYRLRPYSYFDTHYSHHYHDLQANRAIMEKIANKCYLPTNQLLLGLIRHFKGDFKVSFSITGTAIEQFKAYAPAVLDSFKQLADTGCVEFINETYYHSLSFLYSYEEFLYQVKQHHQLIQNEFNFVPKTFRNTELIYNNHLAKCIEDLGFNTILAEGVEKSLGWRSSNFVYQPEHCQRLKLLLRNYQLSDDIAFRFSNRSWHHYPLTAEKYTFWVHQLAGNAEVLNLFMDYETFGEHQWQDTGIFDFLKSLPKNLLLHPDFYFSTPNEISNRINPIAKLDIPHFISWADEERDLTAWLGNDLQHDAIDAVYQLESRVKASQNPELIRTWRTLQTSDHFYYMCTKWFNDGDVHKYFNHFSSPYDAYTSFQNIINDFREVLQEEERKKVDDKVDLACASGIPAI